MLTLLLVAAGMSDLVPDLAESSVLLVLGRIDDIPISTLSVTVDAFLSGDFGRRVGVRVFRARQVPSAATTGRMSAQAEPRFGEYGDGSGCRRHDTS